MSITLPWLTVTMRDDRSFSKTISMPGHNNRGFIVEQVYNALIKIDEYEGRIGWVYIMLEDANCHYITKKYKQFRTDLIYPTVWSFLESWNVIDRRVLVEKIGFYI